MRVRTFQVALSVLSGYVDAIGFLSVSGSYAAFMSGNSTLIGLGAAGGAPDPLPLTGGLVACFVSGVMLGTLVGDPLMGGARARWRPVGVLLLVTVLLTVAAALDAERLRLAGLLVLAVAMGAVNTVFNRPGHSGVGLTYMTGTLVRIGQRLAEVLRGGSWTAVVPDLALWAGMVGGAVLGTVAFHRVDVSGLWAAAGLTLLLAGVVRVVVPAEPRG